MTKLETLAHYFDRTKSEKQRSLQKLGHPKVRQITAKRGFGASKRSR